MRNRSGSIVGIEAKAAANRHHSRFQRIAEARRDLYIFCTQNPLDIIANVGYKLFLQETSE